MANILNKAAEIAEQGARKPAPSASPTSAESCPMCKAMVDHQDPEKVKAFMDGFNK